MVPEGLGHVVQLHRLPAQAAGEGGHLHSPVGLRGSLGFQFLVPGDAVLVFGPPGLGPPHDPLVLHPEDGLALALGGLLHLLLLGFQFQVLGIVGLIVADVAVGELGDPVAHPLQKVSVVGDHNEAPGELPQPVLQPGHHLAVQVVGGLVQDEHVRRVEEDGGQGHPLPLAAGEGVHRLGEVGDPQPGEHGLGLVLQQGPGVRGEVVKDLLQHRGSLHHGGVLGQEAHLDVGVQGHRPLVGDLLPCQHPEEAALPRAVDADDADFIPLVEVEGDVLQQLLEAKVQRNVLCGEQHRDSPFCGAHRPWGLARRSRTGRLCRRQVVPSGTSAG